jgi:CheY-like chemotaxis protein
VSVIVLTEETDQQMAKRFKPHGTLTCVPKRYLTAAVLQAEIGTAVEKHLAWPPLFPPPVSGQAVLAQYFRAQPRAPDLLIVDDDANLVGALQRRLRPQGYEMRSAYAVDQAIDSVKTSQPDLILLDIKLPVVSGWWLAEWLQASRDTAEIPVIVLTGLAAPEVEAQSQAYGVFACLTKPVVTATLLDTIKDALSSHERP